MTPRLMVLLFAATLAFSGTLPPIGPGNSLTAVGHGSRPSHPTPPQSRHYRGEPGYNIVSPSSVHIPARSGGTPPVFRGGVHSVGSTTASTTTPLRGALIASGPTLFNNLNKPGMPANGGETPPDSTGAIGPNNYVEMDNSSIAVYDRNLNTVASTTIDNFVGAAGTPFCDPQVQWDNTANRWLMSALFCNTSSSVQAVLFAWSATSDPSNLVTCPPSTPGCTGWCQFAFRNDPYLLDFQKLGHSAGFLVVGGNLYDETTPSLNPPFASAGIEWAPLPTNNSDTSCTPPPFASNSGLGLKNGDATTPSFTPVPVNQTSNNSDVWIVSAYDPAGNVNGGTPTTQSRLATWDLDGAGVLHQRADINVNSYQTPTAANQLGSGNTIDTLDGRLTQAAGNASAGIWTQHTVLDSSGRSEVDWYELVQSGLNLTLFQQGNVDTANAWTFNAAISPRWDGQGAAIFYNVSSTTQDPVIVAQTRRAATALDTFDPGRTNLASSSAADGDLSCNNPTPGLPCRWGDYSGASPDPVHQTIVWGTNEFNTATGSTPAWRDENFALHAAQTPGPAGTPVARSDGRGDVALTWSPAGFEPDACPAYTLNAFVSGVFAGLSMTVTGAATAAQFRGLTAGTAYTFTVTPSNCGVVGTQSGQSNPVTIDNAITSDPSASPQPRPGVTPEPSASPPPR